MEKQYYSVTLCSHTEDSSWPDSWHTAHDVVEAFSAEDALVVFKQNPQNKPFLNLGKITTIEINLRVNE